MSRAMKSFSKSYWTMKNLALSSSKQQNFFEKLKNPPAPLSPLPLLHIYCALRKRLERNEILEWKKLMERNEIVELKKLIWIKIVFITIIIAEWKYHFCICYLSELEGVVPFAKNVDHKIFIQQINEIKKISCHSTLN